MYYDLTRPPRFAETHAVMANRRYAARLNRQRRRSAPLAPRDPLDFDTITDPENLCRAFQDARRVGGHAPGSDGITYADLGKPEVADAMRRISALIRAGTYVPQPARHIGIPRPDGRPRPLEIPAVFDRAVSTAVAQALAPAIEQRLSPYTYGYRTGYSPLAMLAALHRQIMDHGHYYVAQSDVRDAFPSVRIADALSDLAPIIPDPRTLSLVETLLRGHESQEVGIPQGNPLSPLAFIHHLDCRLGAHRGAPGTPALLRYADNLVVASNAAPVGQNVIDEASTKLSQVGLNLHCVTPPIDIRQPGAWIDVLGIRISVRSGRMQYGLAPEATQALTNSLADRDHGMRDPASARAAVLGWLTYIAPVYGNTQRAARILRQAMIVTAESGYRDIVDDSRLTATIESATERWNRLLHGSIVDDRSTSDVEEMHLAAEMRELRAPRVPNDRTALGARPAVAQDTPGPGVAPFRFFP